MSISVFLTILSALSIITSVLVDWTKGYFPKISTNLYVLGLSLPIGWIGTGIIFSIKLIPWTPINIIFLILMGPAVFFSATQGYDKVRQTIEQVTKDLQK